MPTIGLHIFIDDETLFQFRLCLSRSHSSFFHPAGLIHPQGIVISVTVSFIRYAIFTTKTAVLLFQLRIVALHRRRQCSIGNNSQGKSFERTDGAYRASLSREFGGTLIGSLAVARKNRAVVARRSRETVDAKIIATSRPFRPSVSRYRDSSSPRPAAGYFAPCTRVAPGKRKSRAILLLREQRSKAVGNSQTASRKRRPAARGGR